jgi:hypothetical protein
MKLKALQIATIFFFNLISGTIIYETKTFKLLSKKEKNELFNERTLYLFDRGYIRQQQPITITAEDYDEKQVSLSSSNEFIKMHQTVETDRIEGKPGKQINLLLDEFFSFAISKEGITYSKSEAKFIELAELNNVIYSDEQHKDKLLIDIPLRLGELDYSDENVFKHCFYLETQKNWDKKNIAECHYKRYCLSIEFEQLSEFMSQFIYKMLINETKIKLNFINGIYLGNTNPEEIYNNPIYEIISKFKTNKKNPLIVIGLNNVDFNVEETKTQLESKLSYYEKRYENVGMLFDAEVKFNNRENIFEPRSDRKSALITTNKPIKKSKSTSHSRHPSQTETHTRQPSQSDKRTIPHLRSEPDKKNHLKEKHR